MIDTHTHIFLEHYNEDREEVIKRALDNNIDKLILPNVDSTSLNSLLQISELHPEICFPLIGLHPTSVKENYEDELKIVEKELSIRKYFGIGEIGIDLYWDKTFIEQQKIAFTNQIRLAKIHKLPIVIHSRNSFDEVYEIINKEYDSSLKGIFHAFSGSKKQLESLLKFETFKFGIGGVVTYKNSGLDKIVNDIPLERIVLETDAPYLTPVPKRGQRNEPAYIQFIAQKIVEIKDVSFREVAEKTTENALEIFNLS